MCGIVGIAGDVRHAHLKMFRNMLIFDQIRGLDSTGIAFVPNGKNTITVEKELGGPDNLSYWGESELLDFKGVPKRSYRVMLGHNRAATIGKVTVENAHPFTYGDITGVHNGSLRCWDMLEDAANIDVDSKAIYNTINKKGIKHLWKELVGAATLVWWNEKEATLNMIRNEERPLYVAKSKDLKTLFWASEDWMIEVAAAKAKVELGHMKDKEGKDLPKIFQISTHDHFTWKPTPTSCELVSRTPLEKKSFVQPKNTNIGGTAGHKSNVVGFRGRTNRGPLKINLGWAVNLPKGSKEIRGTEAILEKTVFHHQGVDVHQYAVLLGKPCADFPAGYVLRVYPDKEDDWEVWKEKAKGDKELYYKVKFRPRVKLGPDNLPEYYSIAQSGVTLSHSVANKKTNSLVPRSVTKKVFRKPQELSEEVKEAAKDIQMFPYYLGGRVSEKRFDEILKNLTPKNSCSHCSDPISIEDANDLHWKGPHEPVCSSCIQEIWQSNNYAALTRGS